MAFSQMIPFSEAPDRKDSFAGRSAERGGSLKFECCFQVFDFAKRCRIDAYLALFGLVSGLDQTLRRGFAAYC